jgi:hypothetical protein
MTTMGITIDPLWLFISLIPSGFGFVLFMYGRKQDRWPQIVSGLLLMVYPYFATTVTSLVVVGVVISAATWWAVRLGW